MKILIALVVTILLLVGGWLVYVKITAPPAFAYRTAEVKRGDLKVYTFSSRSVNQRGELVCEGTWTNFVR